MVEDNIKQYVESIKNNKEISTIYVVRGEYGEGQMVWVALRSDDKQLKTNLLEKFINYCDTNNVSFESLFFLKSKLVEAEMPEVLYKCSIVTKSEHMKSI